MIQLNPITFALLDIRIDFIWLKDSFFAFTYCTVPGNISTLQLLSIRSMSLFAQIPDSCCHYKEEIFKRTWNAIYQGHVQYFTLERSELVRLHLIAHCGLIMHRVRETPEEVRSAALTDGDDLSCQWLGPPTPFSFLGFSATDRPRPNQSGPDFSD